MNEDKIKKFVNQFTYTTTSPFIVTSTEEDAKIRMPVEEIKYQAEKIKGEIKWTVSKAWDIINFFIPIEFWLIGGGVILAIIIFKK